MSKIFNGNYTRLDDDVSIQLVRTNPILTTNTKLMYDGKNLYLESYDANPLLTTQRYKNFRVKRTSPFNMDIRNFLTDSGDSAYDVFEKESDMSICDSYDKQFETMYWCGVESINSKQYPQELGFIAPLYIRKKLPNYFVIFKVDGPSNYNLTRKENSEEFKDFEFKLYEDVFKNAKIIKSFDLREGTPIGSYIKKYVEQSNFEYDKSVYVNFTTNEIVYYGIDKIYGVLTTKKENFKRELLENDNTIMHSDEWITSGYKRNGLIYPYIFNMEFLFDDDDTENYEFSRYFGMYCNDIDLYEFEVRHDLVDKPENIVSPLLVGNPVELTVDYDEELCGLDIEGNEKEKTFFYIKDKNNDLHQISSIKNYVGESDSETDTLDIEIVDKIFDLSTVCGFEKTGVSSYCERVDNFNRSGKFSFEVNKNFKQGEQIRLWFGDGIYKEFTAVTDDDENPLPVGQFEGTKFSAEGSVEDMVRALCECINTSYEDGFALYQALYDKNMVVIRCISYVGYNHTDLVIELDESLVNNGRVTVYESDINVDEDFQKKDCVFKVKKEDKDIFLDTRYLKTIGENKINSRILSCVPYVNENGEVESDYFELTTDKKGVNVNVSNTNMVEIIDRFYPKFGVLSFFPVMDFDFDTVFSSYGIYQAFYNECAKLEEHSLENDDGGSEYNRGKITTLAQGYMKDYGGRPIDTEYEYFMENFIPELSTVSKCVPYITKWGYYDDEKDSCENPYRLNMSKIFGTSNLSSNTFSNQYSINEHTHSMPYYLVKKKTSEDESTEENMDYQYVNDTIGILDMINYTHDSRGVYNECVKKCIELFEDTEVDNFDRLFSYKTDNDKRFNKKYSRMKFGDENHFATTLFRGVKFNIKKVNDDDMEMEGTDYNDYKFSFIYIPVALNSIFNSDDIYFVKNDTFKFIVGFILVNMFDKDTSNVSSKYNIDNFGKAYIYGGCYGLLTLPDFDEGESDSESESDNHFITLRNIPIESLFEEIERDEYNWFKINGLVIVNQSIIRIIDNLDDEYCISSMVIRNSDYEYGREYTGIKVENNTIGFDSENNQSMRTEDLSKLVVDLTFKDKPDETGDSLVFKDFYSIYESLSTCAIKERLEDETMTHYYSTTDGKYKIEIEDPISFNTYDIFMGNPYIVQESNENVPASSKITLKNNTNDIVLKTINRYSGYYNPIFNPVLMYNDYRMKDDSGEDSDSDSEYMSRKEYKYVPVDKSDVNESLCDKRDSVPESPSIDDSPFIYTDELYKLVESSTTSYWYDEIDTEGHTSDKYYTLPVAAEGSPDHVTIISDFYKKISSYETVEETTEIAEVMEPVVTVPDDPTSSSEDPAEYVYTRELYLCKESGDMAYHYVPTNEENDNYVYMENVPNDPTPEDPDYIYCERVYYKRVVVDYEEIDESDIDSSEEPTFLDKKPNPKDNSDEYVAYASYYERKLKYWYVEIEKGEIEGEEYTIVSSSENSGIYAELGVNDNNLLSYYSWTSITTTPPPPEYICINSSKFYKRHISYYYEQCGFTSEAVRVDSLIDSSDSDDYYDANSDSDEFVYIVNQFYRAVYRYQKINDDFPNNASVIYTPLTEDNDHNGYFTHSSYENEYLLYIDKLYKLVYETNYGFILINEDELDGQELVRVYERPSSESDSDSDYYTDGVVYYYVTGVYGLQYSYESIGLGEIPQGYSPSYRADIQNVTAEDEDYIYLNEQYYQLQSDTYTSYSYELTNEDDFDYGNTAYGPFLPSEVNQYSSSYFCIRKYYKLVEKEVFEDNDFPTYKYSNTSFDLGYKDFYGQFALIKNLWFHKVNEYYPDKIIKLMNPLYPAIGEFALDYRDYNIFESNWDDKYFTTQVDKKTTERCAGTSGSLNKMSMFGSKYLNVPEEITIETFNRCIDWNDDFITSSKISLSDIMCKEVNGTSVSFYLFLYNRIVRYFARESGLKYVFEEYVNPEYSYGDKTTISDDITSYIEKNIMKLYYLDKIEMWVKEKKVGIHDSRIENNYKKFILIDNSVKVTKDMKKVNTFSIKKMTENQFDRCITYNLKKGCKEDFGFSFTIKKI